MNRLKCHASSGFLYGYLWPRLRRSTLISTAVTYKLGSESTACKFAFGILRKDKTNVRVPPVTLRIFRWWRLWQWSTVIKKSQHFTFEEYVFLSRINAPVWLSKPVTFFAQDVLFMSNKTWALKLGTAADWENDGQLRHLLDHSWVTGIFLWASCHW